MLIPWWRDILTLGGVALALVGVFVALVQLHKTRRAAEEAQRAAHLTREKIRSLVAVGELSSVQVMAREIQEFLRSQDYRVALLRMEDLTSQLAEVPVPVGEAGKSLEPALTSFIALLERHAKSVAEMARGAGDVSICERIIEEIEVSAVAIGRALAGIKYDL